MPSDSSLKAFLSSLSPEDVATLFAGLRNTLPIGMGVYSPELNAGEAEIVGKRQAEREAARVREMEILTRLLPQAMAKRQAAIPESGADPFVPTRPRIMRESPFMFTQPRATPVPQQYADGGPVTPDHTQPDMSDGGQMIADPNLYAGGGSVLKGALGLAEQPAKAGAAKTAAKGSEALSAVERQANLDKMLEASQVKQPLYHASRSPDINTFHSWSHFGTKKAAEDRAKQIMQTDPKGVTTYPVHALVRNPIRTEDLGLNQAGFWNLDKLIDSLDPNQVNFSKWSGGKKGLKADYATDQDPYVVEDFLRRNGYDSIVYKNRAEDPGSDSYIIFNPKNVKSATGNRGTFDVTDPDMTKAEGGAVQAFSGGGKAEALKLLKGDLWHGGTYTKGDKITRPLYTTPDKEMAESYADKSMGSVLQRLRVDVKNPAPERLVRAASRKFVPENEASGYTPASAFDDNINDPAGIAAMIRELRRRGYDSAVATDIGMGRGATEAPALVLFPGSKAYQKGGSVFGKKSLDEMQAELLSKEGLSRRALFGLKPDYPLATKQEPISKVEQEVKRAEQAARKQGQAPSVTASRVDVDLGTGRKKSLMESVTETPVSRRTVLKTAGSQVAQNVLPMGDLMKLAGAPAVTSPVGAIAKATQAARPTVPLVPLTAQGVIARAARMGLDEDETIALLEKMNVADEYDVLYMMPGMRNPYDFYEDFGSEQMSRARALANLINTDMNKPMQMRGPLREIKRENPDMYKELKEAAQDIYDYGQEF